MKAKLIGTIYLVGGTIIHLLAWLLNMSCCVAAIIRGVFCLTNLICVLVSALCLAVWVIIYRHALKELCKTYLVFGDEK